MCKVIATTASRSAAPATVLINCNRDLVTENTHITRLVAEQSHAILDHDTIVKSAKPSGRMIVRGFADCRKWHIENASRLAEIAPSDEMSSSADV
jgi:hypothetical protein